MKPHMRKSFIALALAVSMVMGAGTARAAARQDYIFGAGSPGGTWEMVATGMAKVLNQYSSFRLLPTTFTTINQAPMALNDNEAALAIGSFDIYERAFKGIDAFKGVPTPNIRQVMSIYDNVMGYLVLGGSKLNAMDEITEKTIIVTTPGNFVNVSIYLRTMHKVGVLKADPEALIKNIRRMTYSQSVDQLSDGNVDIAYVTGFPYNGTADAVISTKGARFIPATKDAGAMERFRAEFDKNNRDLTMLIIPKGTYATSTEDVWGPVFYTSIYASKDTPNEVVKEFIDLSITHMKEIAAVHPSAAGITLEANKRNLESGIMEVDRMHPGAVEYFREMGILK
jgi:TRAP transporter TAXI family solute receptor